MADKTDTQRWLDEQAYRQEWYDRSEELMNMFLSKEDPQPPLSFAEYGCGPYAPFSKIATGHSGFSVNKYDIRKWDDQTQICDLNDADFVPNDEQVCVLSGVCEYLNSIEDSLKKLSKSHGVFLLSYAYFPDDSRLDCHGKHVDFGRLKMLGSRINEYGWRNHHTLPEFLRLVEKVGYICGMGHLRGQVLLMVRRY